ncbi:LOW QUALITY PROTEIN: hypothetical protein ElyMa_001790800 [Elysia marginata]|uniref:Galectin n=1 Tax=Elysia marginata TaxID=1093978 RepID=A0AAV4EFS0_9GAST|nr:LOW QUALITY PROTEIN: hypothetical protein ElyMa_001790800 [Elysia marginata]
MQNCRETGQNEPSKFGYDQEYHYNYNNNNNNNYYYYYKPTTTTTTTEEATTAEAITEAQTTEGATTAEATTVEETTEGATTAEATTVEETTEGATTSAGGNCLRSTLTFSSHEGFPTGSSCQSFSGVDINCVIECTRLDQTLCKLVYVASCNVYRECTCIFCTGMEDADFDTSNFQFFLHTKEVSGTNSSYRSLSRGLVHLQPSLLKIKLGSPVTTIVFRNNTDEAFHITFSFTDQRVTTNWRVSNSLGTPGLSTVPFSFTDGQVISIFLIVTSGKFKFYVDQVLLFNLEHSIPPSDVTYFLLESSNSEATIISFRR